MLEGVGACPRIILKIYRALSNVAIANCIKKTLQLASYCIAGFYKNFKELALSKFLRGKFSQIPQSTKRLLILAHGSPVAFVIILCLLLHMVRNLLSLLTVAN